MSIFSKASKVRRAIKGVSQAFRHLWHSKPGDVFQIRPDCEACSRELSEGLKAAAAEVRGSR